MTVPGSPYDPKKRTPQRDPEDDATRFDAREDARRSVRGLGNGCLIALAVLAVIIALVSLAGCKTAYDPYRDPAVAPQAGATVTLHFVTEKHIADEIEAKRLPAGSRAYSRAFACAVYLPGGKPLAELTWLWAHEMAHVGGALHAPESETLNRTDWSPPTSDWRALLQTFVDGCRRPPAPPPNPSRRSTAQQKESEHGDSGS